MDNPNLKLSTDEEMEAIGRIVSGIKVIHLHNWMFHPIILQSIENNRSISSLSLDVLKVDSEEKINALCSLLENMAALRRLAIAGVYFSCEEYMLRFTVSLSKANSINSMQIRHHIQARDDQMQFLQNASSLNLFSDYIRTSKLKSLAVYNFIPSIKVDDLLQAFLECGGTRLLRYGCSIEKPVDEIISKYDISKMRYLSLEQPSDVVMEYLLRNNPSLANFYNFEMVTEVAYRTGLSPKYLMVKKPTVDVFPIICNHIEELTVDTLGFTQEMMKSFIEVLKSPSLKRLSLTLTSGYYKLFEQVINDGHYNKCRLESLSLKNHNMTSDEFSKYIEIFLSLDHFPNIESLSLYILDETITSSLSQSLQKQKRHEKKYLKSLVIEENNSVHGDSILKMLMDTKLEYFANTSSEIQFSTQLLVDLIVTNKFLTKLALLSNPSLWINDDEFTQDAIMIFGALQLNWNLVNFSCVEFDDKQFGNCNGLVNRFIEEKIHDRNRRQVFINKLMNPIFENPIFHKLSDLAIHISN